MFTVKEVSEILNISPHTLRFYDNEGLLPTLTRHNKRRVFTYEDLEWVYTIQCFRDTGMPLAQIKHYIELALQGEGTIKERHEIILQQYANALEEVKAAKARVKILERKNMWYQELMRGADPNKWRPNIRQIVKQALDKKQGKVAKAV